MNLVRSLRLSLSWSYWVGILINTRISLIRVELFDCRISTRIYDASVITGVISRHYECQKLIRSPVYFELLTGWFDTLDVSFTAWLKEMIAKEIWIPKGNPLCCVQRAIDYGSQDHVSQKVKIREKIIKNWVLIPFKHVTSQ